MPYLSKELKTNSNNLKSTCNHCSLSSTNSARCLQTGRQSSCKPASSYYSRATTVDGLHIQEPKNTCRCCEPSSVQSEPNSSRTLVKKRVVFQLLSQAVILHSIHVSVKILKFGGLNTGWSTTPHPPTKKASTSDCSLEGYRYYQKAALKFTGSWGSWGSEVPKSAPTPHLPDKLNPLLDSLTPLVTCSKVGTFNKRPMDR